MLLLLTVLTYFYFYINFFSCLNEKLPAPPPQRLLLASGAQRGVSTLDRTTPRARLERGAWHAQGISDCSLQIPKTAPPHLIPRTDVNPKKQGLKHIHNAGDRVARALLLLRWPRTIREAPAGWALAAAWCHRRRSVHICTARTGRARAQVPPPQS